MGKDWLEGLWGSLQIQILAYQNARLLFHNFFLQQTEGWFGNVVIWVTEAVHWPNLVAGLESLWSDIPLELTGRSKKGENVKSRP